MIVALQTLIYFRESIATVLDRWFSPYYKRLHIHLFSSFIKSDESDDEDSEDQVFADYDDEKGVVFFPPMYAQRYAAVSDCLIDERWFGQLEKVVDLGYHDMTFIKYLKEVPGVKKILGVDIESIPLRCTWDLLWEEYSPKRDNPLKISLFQGNAADPDYRLIGCDAVVSIEMIEHMLPYDLDRLVHTVFGFIRPRVAVFTTPNGEFNVLFKNLEKNGLRRWDHFFEWSREQFNEWCTNIVLRYPEYVVQCRGIGPGPEGTSHLGCCSQLALFYAKDYHKQPELDLDCLALMSSAPSPGDIDAVIGVDSNSEHTLESITLPNTNCASSYALFDTDDQPDITVVLSAPPYCMTQSSFDKTSQCNRDSEVGKGFLMFDEEESGQVRLPSRKVDYKVYEMEDVSRRLNCTTFHVKKFSKTTQKLMAKNKIDSLVYTREVVDEIKRLVSMLNFNKDTKECEQGALWNYVNWGENAPYWNQYYKLVKEYNYPFEVKSEECRILDLISDEINSLVDQQLDGEVTFKSSRLEIPIEYLMRVVENITTDIDRVRELLEWNGYEIVNNMVIHTRQVPDDVSERIEDCQEIEPCSDWDSLTNSDGSNANVENQDIMFNNKLRRALDVKLQKLRSTLTADEDITHELDHVVCRLMKLALRNSRAMRSPPSSRWMQCKLYDLLTLTERAIQRRRMHFLQNFQVGVMSDIENSTKSAVLLMRQKESDSSAIKIMEKYENILGKPPVEELLFEIDNLNLMTDESITSPPPSDDSNDPNDVKCSFLDQSEYQIETAKEILDKYDNIINKPTVDELLQEVENLNVFGNVSSPYLSEHSKEVDSVPNIFETDLKPYINSFDIFIKGSPHERIRAWVDNDTKCDIYRTDSKSKVITSSGQTSKKETRKKYKKQKKQKGRKHTGNRLLQKSLSKTKQKKKIENYENQQRLSDIEPIADENEQKSVSLSESIEKYVEETDDSKATGDGKVSGKKRVNFDSNVVDVSSAENDRKPKEKEHWTELRRKVSAKECKDVSGSETLVGEVTNGTAFVQKTARAFLYDYNEPTTSKGIRHCSMDAQCGPELGQEPKTPPLAPSLTNIPDTKGSMTNVLNLSNHCVEFGTSTQDETKVEKNITPTLFSVGIKIKDSLPCLQNKIDSSTVTECMEDKVEVYTDTQTTNKKEVNHQEDEIQNSVSCVTKNTSKAVVDHQAESSTKIQKSFSCGTKDVCEPVIADETRSNTKVEKSFSYDTKDTSNSVLHDQTISNTKIQKTFSSDTMDDATMILSAGCSKYSLGRSHLARKTLSKLSCGGVHIHSYKDRQVLQDVVYQGEWQRSKQIAEGRGSISPTKSTIRNTRKTLVERNQQKVYSGSQSPNRPPQKTSSRQICDQRSRSPSPEQRVQSKQSTDPPCSRQRPSGIQSRTTGQRSQSMTNRSPSVTYPKLKPRLLSPNILSPSPRNQSTDVAKAEAPNNKELSLKKVRVTKNTSTKNISKNKTDSIPSKKAETVASKMRSTAKKSSKTSLGKVVATKSSCVIKTDKKIAPKSMKKSRIPVKKRPTAHKRDSQSEDTSPVIEDCKEILINSTLTDFMHQKIIPVNYIVFQNEIVREGNVVEKSSANEAKPNSTLSGDSTSSLVSSTASSPDSIQTVKAVPPVSDDTQKLKKKQRQFKSKLISGNHEAGPSLQDGATRLLKKSKESDKTHVLQSSTESCKSCDRSAPVRSSYAGRKKSPVTKTNINKTSPRNKLTSNVLNKNNVNNPTGQKPQPPNIINAKVVLISNPQKKGEPVPNAQATIEANAESSKGNKKSEPGISNVRIIYDEKPSSGEIGTKNTVESLLSNQQKKSLQNSGSPWNNVNLGLHGHSDTNLLNNLERYSAASVSNTLPGLEDLDLVSFKSIPSYSNPSERFIAGTDMNVESVRNNSVEDLFERKPPIIKEHLTPGLLALSGFSMTVASTSGDQPNYVNLVDSETGSGAVRIKRQVESEEAFTFGRTSGSFSSCVLDEDSVVPDWLFGLINQQNQMPHDDEDTERILVPVPPPLPFEGQIYNLGTPVEPAAGPDAGAGDGRGIHSDYSQNSNTTSATPSTESSGVFSEAVLIDPTSFTIQRDITRNVSSTSTVPMGVTEMTARNMPPEAPPDNSRQSSTRHHRPVLPSNSGFEADISSFEGDN